MLAIFYGKLGGAGHSYCKGMSAEGQETLLKRDRVESLQ